VSGWRNPKPKRTGEPDTSTRDQPGCAKRLFRRRAKYFTHMRAPQYAHRKSGHPTELRAYEGVSPCLEWLCLPVWSQVQALPLWSPMVQPLSDSPAPNKTAKTTALKTMLRGPGLTLLMRGAHTTTASREVIAEEEARFRRHWGSGSLHFAALGVRDNNKPSPGTQVMRGRSSVMAARHDLPISAMEHTGHGNFNRRAAL